MRPSPPLLSVQSLGSVPDGEGVTSTRLLPGSQEPGAGVTGYGSRRNTAVDTPSGWTHRGPNQLATAGATLGEATVSRPLGEITVVGQATWETAAHACLSPSPAALDLSAGSASPLLSEQSSFSFLQRTPVMDAQARLELEEPLYGYVPQLTPYEPREVVCEQVSSGE